jgi:hypothetical protein
MLPESILEPNIIGLVLLLNKTLNRFVVLAVLPECDCQIEQCLTQFSDQVDVEAFLPIPSQYRRNKPQDSQPAFDLRRHLYRISGVDFTQINRLGALTVQTILSEVGLDPTRFPKVKHFCSWLGLSPDSWSI